MPDLFNDQLTPETATNLWRESAIKKLGHSLQRMAAVSQRLPKGTREWRLQNEAYDFAQRVYNDLLDLLN